MGRTAYLTLASGTAIGLILGAMVGGGAIWAQETGGEAAAPTPAAPDETVVLDMVIVTAGKREQTEATMPVSTTVIEADKVTGPVLDFGAELARQSPTTNLVDYSRAGETYATMRGIATLGSPLNSLDNTVGFAVDGVPTSTSGFAPVMMDVERVEVLRGPQGTAFGRNALAGGFNVVNMPADGVTEARLDAETGSDGYRMVQAVAGGWLVPDLLAARGVVRFQEFDGDIPNILLDRDLGAVSVGAGRGTLRFTPDDTLTIDVTGGYSKDERNNPSYLLRQAPGFPVSAEDTEPLGRRTIGHGTLNIAKTLDDFTVTSITGYQDIDILNDGDFTDTLIFSRIVDISALIPVIGPIIGPIVGPITTPIIEGIFSTPGQDRITTAEGEKIFTQELRLNSAADSSWQWVVGASYFRSDYDIHRDMRTLVFAVLNGTVDNNIFSETWAGFADASIPLGEHWEISGGIRIARDEQRFEGRYVSNGYPGTVPSLEQQDDYSDTYLTWRAALSYHWTPDVTTYASIARGYASGGYEKLTPYAAYGVESEPFLPAKVLTYEVGAKTTLFDRIRLNAALFWNEVKDGQLSSFDNATFQIFLTNQDYRSYGAEVGVVAELLEGLEFAGSTGFTETRQLETTARSAAAGAAEGNKAPQVPTWTVNLGLTYRIEAEAIGLPGAFVLGADYQYMGSRQADVANNYKLDPYTIVNARIGWEGEHLGFYAFARNILDERPISFALDYRPGVTGVYAGRGRYMGVGATVKW